MASRNVLDPLQLTSLPPLFLDLVAAGSGDEVPTERCVDDCLILVQAYAQLGIAAETLAAELVAVRSSTGQSATHGSLTPRWEDSLFHGHTVIWIPALRHLIDPTAEQYDEIAACRCGPIIDKCRVVHVGAGVQQMETRRAGLRLSYRTLSAAATAPLLDHPVVRNSSDAYRRRGINIASQVVAWLAESQTLERIRLIPNKRAAVLVEAVRGLPEQPTEDGDCRFVLTGPRGEAVIARLDEIPLPAGTPTAALP